MTRARWIWLLALLLWAPRAYGQACVTCRTEKCPNKASLPDWCGEGADPRAAKKEEAPPKAPEKPPEKAVEAAPEKPPESGADRGAERGERGSRTRRNTRPTPVKPKPEPAVVTPPPEPAPPPPAPVQAAPTPVAPPVERTPVLTAPVLAQRTEERRPAAAKPRWRSVAKWTALGVGVAAVAVGAAMLAVDGRGTCDLTPGQEECPQVLGTGGLGIGMLVTGGVALATSGLFFGLDLRARVERGGSTALATLGGRF